MVGFHGKGPSERYRVWTYRSLSNRLLRPKGFPRTWRGHPRVVEFGVVHIHEGLRRCEKSLTGFRSRNRAIDETEWVESRALEVEDKKALKVITRWVEYATSRSTFEVSVNSAGSNFRVGSKGNESNQLYIIPTVLLPGIHDDNQSSIIEHVLCCGL